MLTVKPRFGCQNVFALKRRIIVEDFFERSSARDEFENIRHANPLAANAGAPSALACLDSDPAQPFSTHITTLLSIDARGASPESGGRRLCAGLILA
jgi:hypothetical protein